MAVFWPCGTGSVGSIPGDLMGDNLNGPRRMSGHHGSLLALWDWKRWVYPRGLDGGQPEWGKPDITDK
ncbi:uncharacterized [Tachysurus ichikawai]